MQFGYQMLADLFQSWNNYSYEYLGGKGITFISISNLFKCYGIWQ